MKLIYKILLSIFFCSCSSIAQTTQYGQSDINSSNASEYANIYANFKKLYVAKLDSESHYKELVLADEFTKKMNHPEKRMAFVKVKEPLKWIEENLSNTFFENYESAVKDWEELLKVGHDEHEQNREYYKLRNQIMKNDWGRKMIGEVTEEIAMEHPEKFDLLDSNKPE